MAVPVQRRHVAQLRIVVGILVLLIIPIIILVIRLIE